MKKLVLSTIIVLALTLTIFGCATSTNEPAKSNAYDLRNYSSDYAILSVKAQSSDFKTASTASVQRDALVKELGK